MSDVVVRKSGIHGKGVFAARDFRKGEVVLKWDTSNELTEKELRTLPEKKKKYVICLDGRYVLMKPPETYVNHSCDNNVIAKSHCDVAIRDIRKGEEITSDYSRECDKSFRMKCSCGSRNCRKFIRSYSR